MPKQIHSLEEERVLRVSLSPSIAIKATGAYVPCKLIINDKEIQFAPHEEYIAKHIFETLKYAEL